MINKNRTANIPKNANIVRMKARDGGHYILLEIRRTYNSETRSSNPHRVIIGKECKDNPEKLHPNENYHNYLPTEPIDTTPSGLGIKRSSVIKIGANLMIDHVMSELNIDVILHENLVENRANLIKDLIAYQVITGSNVSQHYETYACEHMIHDVKEHRYSDATVGRVYKEITEDRVTAILQKWNLRHAAAVAEIWVMYDSTNKNCQSGDIEIVQFGHAKIPIGRPIFNLSVAYDGLNRIPLFYELYSGSIPDVSQFEYMLERVKAYGYVRVNVCIDRGYFSESNIRKLDEFGYGFIIMMKGQKELVKELVLQEKDSFRDRAECIVATSSGGLLFGKTVERDMFGKKRYVHLYFSPSKYLTEVTALNKYVKTASEKLNRYINKPATPELNDYKDLFKLTYDNIADGKSKAKTRVFVFAELDYAAYDDKLSTCGYFCIISSNEKSASEAYKLYSSRDASEKLFASAKTFLGSSCARVHSLEALTGKTLIEFFALVVRARIYALLKDEWSRISQFRDEFTVTKGIKALEMIKLKQHSQGSMYCLECAFTRAQKNLFAAIGLDEFMVKERAFNYIERLANSDSMLNEQINNARLVFEAEVRREVDNFLPLFINGEDKNDA